MSRYLIVSLQVSQSASKGHINPMIGVARQLRARGHEIAWLSLPSAMGPDDARQVQSIGAVLLQTPTVPPGVIRSSAELAGLTQQREKAWLAYQSFLLDPLADLVPAVREVIRAARPSAIAIDTMAYAGIIAASLERTPFVGVCAGLKILKAGGFAGGYMHDLSPLVEARRMAFAAFGLGPEFRLLECLSPHANAVFATRAFVGAIDLPPCTHLVGPSVVTEARGDETPFPWERLAPRKRKVLAAFGSVHGREALLDLVTPLAQATSRLGVQLIVASEALAGSSFGNPGDIVLPYLPQCQLLGQVDAFVTHGGANSVAESLYSGRPLLVVPLSGDQPWQAHLVEQSGAGLAMSRDAVNEASMGEALSMLLDAASPYGARARLIQTDYVAHDGAAGAATLVEQVAATSPGGHGL